MTSRLQLLADPKWWWSGSLRIPESSKIERGSGGDLRDALTGDGDGWRWSNFEAAMGRTR
jgi:hypothetical protein